MWKIGDKWINSRIGGSDSSTPLSHGGGQSSCLLFLGHLLGSEDGLYHFWKSQCFSLPHETHVKQLFYHNSCQGPQV